MKSKSPRRNSTDFYSFDDSVGRPGATPGKGKRDRKPSIYDEDDDYDYRQDLLDEDDGDFFSDDQPEEVDFNQEDFDDEEDFDEDFDEDSDDDEDSDEDRY